MTLAMLAVLGCGQSAADLLLTCAGGNASACYAEGLAAANAPKPRYDEARAAWSTACMGNHDAQSCFELGHLVRDAKGGPRDVHRAAELFEIACRGGIDFACVELGILLYVDQDGMKAEPEKAVTLFTEACEKVDPAAAPEGAPHPLALACDALGVAYLEGVGVEPPNRDEEKAAQLFDRACAAHHPQGCVSAGAILAKSRREEKVDRAAELYGQACKMDARYGCFELAELHETKAWKGATDELASRFFQRTCNHDPTRGCYEAGLLMESGRVKAREGEIESMFNVACEHGNGAACAKRKVK